MTARGPESIGAVGSTTPALTGNTATASLATLAPPVAGKAFSPATIGVGSTSTMTIAISNPNGTIPGGGTPNNALQDGGQSGIGQVAVRLTNTAGGTTYDGATTDAAGSYRLWLTAALSGNSLCGVEDNAAAYRSAGGASPGSHDRVADAFTYAAGSNTANLNFADVAIETLTSPLPGGRIACTITFTNQGSGAITSIRINGVTPAFTRFVNAACVAPLAVGLSACNVTASPAAGASGAIEPTLTGALLPGASGQLSFAVGVASGP